jgi:cell division septal protein FtsQ
MKARNQRISSTRLRKQQHLLEVTVRSDKARTIRNRTIAAFLCKTIFFVSLVVGAWLGGKELLRRFVWENPEYVLNDIRVSTDGALQRDQILQAGAVRAGVNIFKVDTESVRAGIDKLPQVERAEIERIRPNRLDITITERHPIAWVTERADEIPTASDKSWLIDARGVVMKTKRMLEEYYHLPHISGVAVANFVPGQRINTVEMQAALELVRLNTDNTRWQARNIDLAKGYCLIVTDQNHAKITFGLDDIGQQFDRLFRYFERADEEKKEIRTVNLLVRKNTPVTFQDPNSPGEVSESTAPPEPAATPAPQKPKEKEVAVVKAATPVPRVMPVSTPIPNTAKSKSDSRTTSRTKSTPSVRKPFRP